MPLTNTASKNVIRSVLLVSNCRAEKCPGKFVSKQPWDIVNCLYAEVRKATSFGPREFIFRCSFGWPIPQMCIN